MRIENHFFFVQGPAGWGQYRREVLKWKQGKSRTNKIRCYLVIIPHFGRCLFFFSLRCYLLSIESQLIISLDDHFEFSLFLALGRWGRSSENAVGRQARPDPARCPPVFSIVATDRGPGTLLRGLKWNTYSDGQEIQWNSLGTRKHFTPVSTILQFLCYLLRQ